MVKIDAIISVLHKTFVALDFSVLAVNISHIPAGDRLKVNKMNMNREWYPRFLGYCGFGAF